jgi:hypothetical protein
MKRREFIVLLSSAAWPGFWPLTARAQYQMMPPQPPPMPEPPPAPPVQAPAAAAAADNSVGQVTTLTGVATVTRANAAAVALLVADPIFKNDTLDTGVNSTLGITFDDETTFSLSADTRIVVNAFVYQEGGAGNAASFNVATGTAAFVASLVAKTGDMTISTPEATLGIRGTTGVVDVPAAGGAAAPTIKLYPDADGHVGSIEVFDRQGARPGATTRYSNLAPSLAGLLVERASGLSFDEYQRARLLKPLGMGDSAWTRKQVPPGRLVTSQMRVADGQGGWPRRTAPVFDLGTIPAGNLYSTVDDLARFACTLLAGGGGLLKPETLDEMWRVQFAPEILPGFGLGFIVGQSRNHRLISHNGAVYGCSSFFALMPEQKLAVIVLGNEDIVGGRIHRVAEAAFAQLLEQKFGEKPPPTKDFPAPPNLAAFVGDYESQSFWARLEVRDGQLTGDVSGQPTLFTLGTGLNFNAHSRIEDATPAVFIQDSSGNVCGFTMGLQQFQRVPERSPPLPDAWRAYCGRYGPDFIPVIVSERHGHLYAMTENMVDYRLTPVNRHACAFPPGMYAGEQVVFLDAADGQPCAIDFANMRLSRRTDS